MSILLSCLLCLLAPILYPMPFFSNCCFLDAFVLVLGIGFLCLLGDHLMLQPLPRRLTRKEHLYRFLGTNKPVHCYVLVGENGMGSAGVQLFSCWTCYLYCRCTRSVSYAPPAYYAHLAALHGRYLVVQRSDSASEGSIDEQTSILYENLKERVFLCSPSINNMPSGRFRLSVSLFGRIR